MRNTRMWRFAAVSTALAGMLAVTACSGGSGGGEAAEGDGTLQVYLVQHSWTEAIKKQIPDFEEQTGLKVEVTELSEGQMADQLQVKLNAQAADVDVMMISPTRQGRQFEQNAWISDITENVDGAADWDWSDFDTVAQNAVTYDDSVYALPLVLERFVMYYRTDLLEAAGLEVPETIEELETAVATLNDPENGVYGFISRGLRQAAPSSFSSFLYSMTGGDWIEDGESQLANDDAIEAYETYGGLLRDYGPPGVLDMNWPQAVPIFAQGQAAFYHDADSIFSGLFAADSKVADKVGFAAFPAGDGGQRETALASWAIAMNEYSDAKSDAWKFMEWATSADTMAKAMVDLVPSPRASVWKDESALVNYPPGLVDLVLNPPADLEYVDHTGPLVVNVGEARDIVGGPIVAAIQGEDVAAAARAASEQLQELIDSEK